MNNEPPMAHDRYFPEVGVGNLLSQSFTSTFLNPKDVLEDIFRGDIIFIASDYSGQHKASKYEVYTILCCDLENCGEWEFRRAAIRKKYLPNGRRMAFKNLNDRNRQKALEPFLAAANLIPGICSTFAVDKSIGALFGKNEKEEKDFDEIGRLLFEWKPKVRERLVTTLHLLSFLAAGVSTPKHQVLWITDEDDIAANDDQLIKLTKLAERIGNHFFQHPIRRFRCGTSRSDTGRRDVEDMLAIPDLISGTIASALSHVRENTMVPQGKVVVPIPYGVPLKTEFIMDWYIAPEYRLRKTLHLIEETDDRKQIRAKQIVFHTL